MKLRLPSREQYKTWFHKWLGPAPVVCGFMSGYMLILAVEAAVDGTNLFWCLFQVCCAWVLWKMAIEDYNTEGARLEDTIFDLRMGENLQKYKDSKFNFQLLQRQLWALKQIGMVWKKEKGVWRDVPPDLLVPIPEDWMIK